MKETSEVKYVGAPVARVYSTLANLENLRPLLDRAQNDESLRQRMREAGQESALEHLHDVELTNDSIAINAPMVGRVSMKVVEREADKCVKFATDQSPIAANIWIQTLPVDDATSKMRVTIDADIPFVLKAMVGSKLKEGINRIADMLAMLNY